MNSTQFNLGGNDHLRRSKDGYIHQLDQNERNMIGACNRRNIAVGDESQKYMVTGENQLYQRKNFTIDEFNRHNVASYDNSKNYVVTGENDHLDRKRDGNNHQLYRNQTVTTDKLNCHSLVTFDNSQNYLVPGEPVSRHRDGKSHQPYQRCDLLVGDEYRRLNVSNDNSQNLFTNDESNHLIRATPKDPRQFRVQRNNEKRDFSRNDWNDNNRHTVPNLNCNRNIRTLNADESGNNNCHSTSMNVLTLHNGQNVRIINNNNIHQFDMPSSHASNASSSYRVQQYQRTQSRSSFQNSPFSSSSSSINIFDTSSSQRNRRQSNPSYDQKYTKYHPITYKIETSMFSNENWPTYKPLGVTYPDGVTNSKLETTFKTSDNFEECFTIHRGILFHNYNIFIFTPISKPDIVNNLMAVVYLERNIHPTVINLNHDNQTNERKKKLRNLMETIAMDFIHAKHFDEENCSGQLYTKYKLSKQNFSSPRTYATLEEKYETMRKMVYYKMPIQRKKKPGRNCEWIKSLSELEHSIIHHPKTMICNVPWHEYIASLPQHVSTERTMDMSSNAESQATDLAMIEDESTNLFS